MAKVRQLPDPVPVAIVLCESIARDLRTNRLHLMGLLGGIGSYRFPMTYSFAIHATVANVRADMVAYFDLVDSDDEVVQRTEDLALIKPPNLLHEASVSAFFEEVPFLQPGDYFVRLWASRRLIMDRRFSVARFEQD